MKKTSILLLLLASLNISNSVLAAESDILGVWDLTQTFRGDDREYTLTLEADGGTWSSERGTSELQNVVIEDDTLSFDVLVRQRDGESLVSYTASIINDGLVGRSSSPGGTRTFIAAKVSEAALKVIADRDNAIAALEECDILAVFAHPDDETFATGTFAKLSTNGHRIQLVYATSGDAGGDLTGQGFTGADLAALREEEMRNAAKVLKLSTEPLFLHYPDGYVRMHWNNILENVESIMKKTQPKIVVTFGPDGYYGHTDHLAISQIAERAFDELGTASNLLHVAIPRSMNDMIIKAGGGNRYKAVDNKYITYIVNVKKQIQQRIGAMQEHRSQFDKQTIQQMRLLGAMTGIEGFVEVRNLGESGTLAEMFSEGDVVRKRR